jgi:vacuolar-type H+-ATPase subunit I/STV1
MLVRNLPLPTVPILESRPLAQLQTQPTEEDTVKYYTVIMQITEDGKFASYERNLVTATHAAAAMQLLQSHLENEQPIAKNEGDVFFLAVIGAAKADQLEARIRN